MPTDKKEFYPLVSRGGSPYELCPICNGIVRKDEDMCAFCKAVKFFRWGKNKVLLASEFKFLGIKLPALMVLGCVSLVSWSAWFLIPAFAAGIVMCRAIQKHREGPAWNLAHRE